MKHKSLFMSFYLMFCLWGCQNGGFFSSQKELTILPRTDTIPELVSVGDHRFTMMIPKGWVIETTGEFQNFGFRVYDPQQPYRTLFYYGTMSPWMKSEEASDFWAWYASTGYPSSRVYADAPVLYDASVEGLFNSYDVFTQFAKNYGINHNFVQLKDFDVIETFDTSTAMASAAIDESTLRLQLHDEDDFPIDAMVTATLVDAMSYPTNGTDVGYYTAYRVSGIIAPSDDFLYHYNRLTESLASFKYNEDYINEGVKLIEWGTQKALEMQRTLSETADIINSSWQYRDQVVDKANAKFISYLRGKSYIVDTETDILYELDHDDMSEYLKNKEKYKSSYTIIDENNPRFGQPVSGIAKP